MNTRKTRKRKVIKLPTDKETVATDKLLQLSFLGEEAFQDASDVLLDKKDQHEPRVEKLQHSFVQANKRLFPSTKRHKTLSLSDYREVKETSFHDKKQVKDLNKTTKCIFNTVSSNTVFVGNLKSSMSHRSYYQAPQNIMMIEAKRRVVTMPSIENKFRSQKVSHPLQRHQNSVRQQLKEYTSRQNRQKTKNNYSKGQLESFF